MACDAHVLCPHCVITPMWPRTNGWGGTYLECPDCTYYESIPRKTARRGKHQLVPQRIPLRIAPAEGIAALQQLAGKLGRTPRWSEMGRDGCPSHHWFRHRFGTMRAALDEAGLAHRHPGNPTGRNNRHSPTPRPRRDAA